MNPRTTKNACAAVAIAAGAATLAVVGGGAANAAPAPLHLVEKGGDVNVVDNPPAGADQGSFSAGDIVVVTRNLYTTRGARAGSLALTCIASSATTQQCLGTITLPHGTLTMGAVSTPKPTTAIAVLGGTGAYAGTTGSATSRDRAGNHDIADLTITFARQ